MVTLSANDNYTEEFKKVFLSELEDIRRSNNVTQNSEDKPPAERPTKCEENGDEDPTIQPSAELDLMGLALSGGGIRSATFNLGLLQSLCNSEMLERIDYLSTVSGGGYIGTCMTTLLNSPSDNGSIGLNENTFPLGRRKIENSEDPTLEKDAVRRLRYFSNYLTAEGGFLYKYLSPAMVFVRGLILNSSLIVPYIVTFGLLLALIFNIKILFPGLDHNPVFFDFEEFTQIHAESKNNYNKAKAELRKYAVQQTPDLSFTSDQERIDWIEDMDGSNERLKVLKKNIETAKKPLKKEWRRIWILPGGFFAVLIGMALLLRACYIQPYNKRYRFSRLLALLFFISIVLVVLQLYGILIIYWKSWEISTWIASASLLSLIGPRLLQAGNGGGGTEKKMLMKTVLAIVLLLLVPLFILYLVGGIIAYVSNGEECLIISLIVGTLVLAVINKHFINLNEISLHNYYRDCLSRAYMMQYDREQKNISPVDDLKFSNLDPMRSPYHIINTTLNLKKRMPRKNNEKGDFRTGESFVFTKNWCGSEKKGYIKTAQYEMMDKHINVGTAMAISGAAANIGMAQKNIFVLRLLMGLLNIRLGYWALNPIHANRGSNKSVFRIFPGSIQAFREWFGCYRPDSRYINLSDGGHFDNIGVYELLRRRCKYIIVGDAEGDAEMKFEAISYIMRLARIDFGIEIKIDLSEIKIDPATGFSRNHCVVGRIEYPEGDFGYLLYCKASLTGDEPEHLHEYKVKNPQFPHQTTADQWFDEQQFEAYRELGYHIGKETFSPVDSNKNMENEELFIYLKEFWYPHSESIEAHFTRHTAELHKIISEIKNDKDLSFMDAQMYPEWDSLISQQTENHPSAPKQSQSNLWLPSKIVEIRKGFYQCNLMIHLMENVYTDLKLEDEYTHPDNRGWMNLFRHWSWSGIFRVSWSISACTFGARFQKFCEKHLDLDLGDLSAEELGGHGMSATKGLNPFEQKILLSLKRKNMDLLDTVYIFKLKVNDPLDQNNHKTFYFGFAIVNNKKELIFFRVQDHLRQMGLGRRALKELRISHGIKKYSGKLIKRLETDEDIDEILKEELDNTAFVRMCKQSGLSKPA